MTTEKYANEGEKNVRQGGKQNAPLNVGEKMATKKKSLMGYVKRHKKEKKKSLSLNLRKISAMEESTTCGGRTATESKEK